MNAIEEWQIVAAIASSVIKMIENNITLYKIATFQDRQLDILSKILLESSK